MIEIYRLHVRYPETAAVRGVDLSIPPGSFTLLGGPSGCGKSTLARTLMGLVSGTSSVEIRGHMSIAGLDPRAHTVAQLARHAGLVFQDPVTQLFNERVEEEVAFGPRNLGLADREVAVRVEEALAATGCTHLRSRPVRRLSSGEQQRVAIAAVLAMRPSVLILDEPTANLDPQGVHSVARILARLQQQFGTTVLLIEHQLEPFLDCADRLVWMDRGRVTADGSPTETWNGVRPPTSPCPEPKTRLGEPLVTLDCVAAGYNGTSILQDCSFILRQGELAALVGANGAGKTTAARVLSGLLRPHRGKVVWHASEGARRVGLLQQNLQHQLICDTVEEEIRYGPRNLGQEAEGTIEYILAHTDIADLRHRPTRTLSAGQQQRTALAATLALEPALLILDEPTVGQDHHHLWQMIETLKELNRAGQTVLLITHRRSLVAACATKVWTLEQGRARDSRATAP